MPNRIEDYALIGNNETTALVGRDGSIDWLGMPRFDSPACFAALLGGPEHGRWLIAPVEAGARVTRRYRGDTLILETLFETSTGAVCVIDFMSRRPGASDLVRIAKAVRGTVAMHTELTVRFDYGSIVPWVARRDDGRLHFAAGPDLLSLSTNAELRGEDMKTVGEFTPRQGHDVCFALTGSLSFHDLPDVLNIDKALASTEAFWTDWSSHLNQTGQRSAAVCRSLLTLKALAHWDTGGIVAAATTSLPEKLGGPRNWDYRLCWLRDATFTLYALLGAGVIDEARTWREWLVRAVAGSPADVQPMYGVAGERRLGETELPWLPGHMGSAPVRIGNAAVGQLQLDVYGAVIGALYVARRAGLAADTASWALERALVVHLESIWEQPDDGIWEMRSQRRHFTHSKMMCWFAFDRAVRSATEFGLEAPVERWIGVRDAIHRQVCERGFDATQNAFVQSYDSHELDAAVLMMPMLDFLPPGDERIKGTVAAIEKNLMRDGLVRRYRTEKVPDGLPPGEGAFLACSFWLVDNYTLQGRLDEAQALYDRLLSYRNDVGLLAEEYDPVAGRQLGNFPQAFSHLALIISAKRLAEAREAAKV